MTRKRVLTGLAIAAFGGAALSPTFLGSASALIDDPFAISTATTTTSTTSTTSTTTPVGGVVDPTAPSGETELVGELLDAIVATVDGLDGSSEEPPEGTGESPEDGGPASNPDPATSPPTSSEPSQTAAPQRPTTASTPVVPSPSGARTIPTTVRSNSPQSPAAALPVPATGGAAAAATDPNVAVHRPGPRPDGGRPSTYVVKQRSGARSTAEIMAILGRLDLSPSAAARLIAPFPVAGLAHYNDDFGDPRRDPSGETRSHEGTDVFAASGTPVVAAAPGRVAIGRGGRAGVYVRLEATDGTEYLYAHLERVAVRLHSGDEVAKGDVIGFVGTTGNAAATPPHVHFEIRPRGGDAVDPVPFLDRWLADATYAAKSLAGMPLGTAGFRSSRTLIEESSAALARRAQGGPSVTRTGRDPKPSATWGTPISALRSMTSGGGLTAVPAFLLVAGSFAVVIRRGSRDGS